VLLVGGLDLGVGRQHIPVGVFTPEVRASLESLHYLHNIKTVGVRVRVRVMTLVVLLIPEGHREELPPAGVAAVPLWVVR
jgi:hypothetical protein